MTEQSGTPSGTDETGLVARYKWTVAKGALVTLVVAGVVGLSGVVLAGLVFGPPADADPEFESFDPERTVETGLPADGTIDPDPEGPIPARTGTVVIDGSGTDRGTLDPLTEAFDGVNYEVTRNTGSIDGSLDDADGLVIVNPQTGYTDDELDAIAEFVDDGGKLVILGEPNRIEFQAAGLSLEVVTVESELTELGAQFDIHFDTRYVYDQQQNDGNFRHVRVEPHPDASLPGGSFSGIDDVVFYTPAEVRSTGGAEPVLVTGPDARMTDSDTVGERTVALRSGNVLAVGDSRFIAADRHNVGDNNVFLASVVEFVVSGEVDPESEEADDEEADEGEADDEESDEEESDEEESDEEESAEEESAEEESDEEEADESDTEEGSTNSV